MRRSTHRPWTIERLESRCVLAGSVGATELNLQVDSSDADPARADRHCATVYANLRLSDARLVNLLLSRGGIPGDANLDLRFDQADLAQVRFQGKYLSETPATWQQGDWNDDGRFDQHDVVLATAAGQYLRDNDIELGNASDLPALGVQIDTDARRLVVRGTIHDDWVELFELRQGILLRLRLGDQHRDTILSPDQLERIEFWGSDGHDVFANHTSIRSVAWGGGRRRHAVGWPRGGSFVGAARRRQTTRVRSGRHRAW